MQNYDAIIIGAGHNGLTTAAYLAKAGKKVLVLERRPVIGGIAATEEIFPGFKFSTCEHLAGSFARKIIADLDLQKHGLQILPLNPLLFAPTLDGHSLVVPPAFAKATDEISRHSKNDAGKYPAFCALLKNLSAYLLTLYSLPLPDRSAATNANPANLFKAVWRFHRLGKKQGYEFLRILPMSIADLLNEWFENELLKAALAAGAIHGSFVGPRQQGTSFNLLHHQLGESNGALRTAGIVRGGIGNLPQALALAARQYGADIHTGAEVIKIIAKNGAATAVV
ncbi:MAG TPA: NAD(P)/FAD-dependent oxidoreductase, partial [Candidatus Binatia bacterium]|nr:NAD(P)/FAD-dependent oxidoreductase [Candidatus Binatia bacterium]